MFQLVFTILTLILTMVLIRAFKEELSFHLTIFMGWVSIFALIKIVRLIVT
jgi:hypothetical protein